MALKKAGIARNNSCRKRLSFDEIVTDSELTTHFNDLTRRDEDSINTDYSEISYLNVHQPEIRSTNNNKTQFDATLPQTSSLDANNTLQYLSIMLDSETPPSSACQEPIQGPKPSNKIKRKVGKRVSKKEIQYIDYISDLEDFSTFYGDITDSDNWSEEQETESEEDFPSGRKKLKKIKDELKIT